MTGLALLLLGLVFSGLGTTAAVAFFGVNQIELYRWIAGRLPGARAAQALLASFERTLGAALGLSAAGALLAGAGLRAAVGDIPVDVAVLTVLLIAIPLLLAALYALPSALGRRRPEPVVKGLTRPLAWLAPILNPVFPHEAAVRPRGSLVRARVGFAAPQATDTGELSLVSGVLAFTDRTVREVMTPRTDIVAVREGAPIEEIGRVFAESGFSRLPVYRDSLDHIEGLFYAFDLLKLAPGSELALRPVTMTPASRQCADLLFEMQRDRRHLAVVLDEYGGTAGIATLQDLLEELVDETFEVEQADDAVAAGDGAVTEVPGDTPTAQIAESLGAELPADAETIGGLLMRAAGRIPQTGERFELADLEFYVLAASPTRVERIAVRRGVTPTIRLKLEGKR
ncbi:MAG: CBS domain-containing protein [Gemmatimonadota bacterium]|nr:MAG: CBS domain-containing protein [Gemmatimonadota bacterium]